MHPNARLAISALLPLLATACDIESIFGGHGCTEIGCSDQVAIAIRRPDQSWEPGAYVFELELDDVTHTCRITLPDDLSNEIGSLTPLRCEPELDAAFSTEAECFEQRTKDAVSQSCRPILGRMRLDVGKQGTPDALKLRIERDGAQIFEHGQDLEYEESRPNGPDCEPLCRQSLVELEL